MSFPKILVVTVSSGLPDIICGLIGHRQVAQGGYRAITRSYYVLEKNTKRQVLYVSDCDLVAASIWITKD